MRSPSAHDSHSEIARVIALLAAVTGCTTAHATPAPNDREPANSDRVAAQAQALRAQHAQAIPDALAVPKGNRLAFEYDAKGVQIYQCQTQTSGAPAWTFQSPQAELHKHGRLVGTHYAGPTWESTDGSTVVGTKLAASVVDTTAIPWLLLQAASHNGRGRMSKVTFIQRLNTSQGLAPTGGCDADHLAQTAAIDYTATYAFYEAASAGAHAPTRPATEHR